MKAKTIGAFQAKTHLSEVLERVHKGQVYHISKRGHPVAELRPLTHPNRRPRFGCDKGRVEVRSDFDDPLPEMGPYTK
jgi:prevent-host-death family protein